MFYMGHTFWGIIFFFILSSKKFALYLSDTVEYLIVIDGLELSSTVCQDSEFQTRCNSMYEALHLFANNVSATALLGNLSSHHLI